jgi:hypothetical protein
MMSSKSNAVNGSIVLFVAFALATVASAQDPNLVGWWPFDETVGTVAEDASGNGNDGVFVGDPQWVPGRVDGALEFNGDDYVNCGNGPSLEVKDEITIAFWFQVEAFVNTWEAFLSKGDDSYRASRGGGTGNATHMGITGTSTGGGNGWFNGTVIVTDGTWHHYAATYDGTEGRIYIDGELDVVSPGTGQINTSSYDLWIGSNSQNTDRLFHGLLDDVRIYDRALSEEEIRALVPPQLEAHSPEPADGNVTVTAPLLQWKAGDTALLHDVYFGTDPNLGPEDQVLSSTPMTLYFHFDGLTPGATYYWRVDEIEADMTTVHTGDVWTFTAQPFTTYLPEPPDGGNEASPDPNLTLTWYPGQLALEHQLYFGNSFDDVNDGAAGTDQGTTAEPSFVLADALQPLSTYYWRVDEINPGDVIETGEVWSFTTYQPVDDFETYTNETGQRVFEVWVDGIGFSLPEPGNPGNGTGAAVGHDVWDPDSPHYNGSIMETGIVYAGAQAMPLNYNNEPSPYYSEAQCTWSVAQNWTAGGVDTLVLHVSGGSANAPEQLYVILEDSAGASHAVVYPDDAAVTTRSWTTWRIPLSTFGDAGVNLAAVRMLAIGLGDRQATAPGGAGTLFVDGIWLTRPTGQ